MKKLSALFCLCIASAASGEPAVAPAAVYAPLALEVGTWAADVQFYEDGKPSRTAAGVQVNTLLANGHWIVNDIKIPATNEYPAYEGHGMWGYDPVSKSYVNTWIDTNDQAVRTDYGFWNEADQTLVWSSKQNDGAGHFVDFRMVEEFKGQQRVFTVYQLGLVKPNEHPVLKIVFTKKHVDEKGSDDAPRRQYERPGGGHLP